MCLVWWVMLNPRWDRHVEFVHIRTWVRKVQSLVRAFGRNCSLEGLTSASSGIVWWYSQLMQLKYFHLLATAFLAVCWMLGMGPECKRVVQHSSACSKFLGRSCPGFFFGQSRCDLSYRACGGFGIRLGLATPSWSCSVAAYFDVCAAFCVAVILALVILALVILVFLTW